MSVNKFIPDVFPTHNGKDSAYYTLIGNMSYNGRVFSLYNHFEQAGDKWSNSEELTILDVNSFEVTNDVFTVDGNITTYDPCPDSIFFYSLCYAQEGITSFEVYERSYSGEFSSPIDLTAIVKGEGLSYTDQYSFSETYRENVYFDSKSQCFYLEDPDKAKIVIADKSGKLLGSFEGFKNDPGQVCGFAKTKDGVEIFRYSSFNQNKMTLFYFDTQDPVILYEGEELANLTTCFDSHNNLIYRSADGSSYISWNPITGKRVEMYTQPVSILWPIEGLLRNEKGDLIIVDANCMNSLTYSISSEEITLTVLPDVVFDYTVEEAMNTYTLMHPNVKFKILDEYSYAERESQVSKAFSEMAKGKGPDIILLDNSLLHTLYKNDCLLNLSEILDEDTKEHLLKGVLDNGMIDGNLYMVSFNACTYSLWVNQNNCPMDSWTYSDILNIIDEREKSGNPFRYLYVSDMSESYPLWIFIPFLTQSDFIDLETKTCNFDSEEFIRILNTCKTFYDRLPMSKTIEEDPIEIMRNDEALLFCSCMPDITLFSRYSSSLGPDCKPIGYPANFDDAYYIILGEGLAVNKNVKRPDVIADFIKFFYSRDNFQTYNIPLRSDIFDGRVVMEGAYDWSTGPSVRAGGFGSGTYYIDLESKPDGSTYIDDYMDTLKKSVPRDYLSEAITDIIYEEADSFFEGGKSAEEVSKVIQSRISIFLSEMD